jgi:hypothetical protein
MDLYNVRLCTTGHCVLQANETHVCLFSLYNALTYTDETGASSWDRLLRLEPGAATNEQVYARW